MVRMAWHARGQGFKSPQLLQTGPAVELCVVGDDQAIYE
jgi:hypothetical protein